MTVTVTVTVKVKVTVTVTVLEPGVSLALPLGDSNRPRQQTDRDDHA